MYGARTLHILLCMAGNAQILWYYELLLLTLWLGHWQRNAAVRFKILQAAQKIEANLKPKSDIHCNRSATSPRPKFKTIAEVAEVAEESQLGFDWSATNRGLAADWSATGRRPRGDLFATWCNWSPTGRGLVPD